MNDIITNYYDSICQEWGYTPTETICSGYESVLPRLKELSKTAWDNADEQGRQQIQDEVYDIYRSIGIVPVVYYNLQGCQELITELTDKKKSVEDYKLNVGNNEGLTLSRFWFPNMQDAKWNDNDTVSLRSRFNHDNKLKRAIKLCYQHRDDGDEIVIPKNLRRALELVNGGTIQNFKPMNARAIWEYICPVWGGNVLDFSSGYGGRMLGAMTSRMRYHYTGIDPNTKTYNGLVALGELIQDTLSTGYEMHHIGSEDFVPETNGFYDAAFSSPPYFNLETYCDEPTQCMNRYTNLDLWFEGYVEPTLRMLHKSLANDGIYAVNIADYRNAKEDFKIVDYWISLSEKMGFRYQHKVDMLLNVRPGVGNGKKDKAFKAEGIYIFKKC